MNKSIQEFVANSEDIFCAQLEIAASNKRSEGFTHPPKNKQLNFSSRDKNNIFSKLNGNCPITFWHLGKEVDSLTRGYPRRKTLTIYKMEMVQAWTCIFAHHFSCFRAADSSCEVLQDKMSAGDSRWPAVGSRSWTQTLENRLHTCEGYSVITRKFNLTRWASPPARCASKATFILLMFALLSEARASLTTRFCARASVSVCFAHFVSVSKSPLETLLVVRMRAEY